MDRLTNKIDNQYFGDYEDYAMLEKLGKLEDIMEYWQVESLEELNYKLNMNVYLEDNKVLGKALELACEKLKEHIICSNMQEADYFIEQAKQRLKG